jgi:futalosine hydrolase
MRILLMSILFCAATPGEISPVREWVLKEGIENVQFLITGVGLVSATYAISKAVLTERPGMLIQAGLAGSLDESIGIGEVRVVRHEIIGDLGVNENGSFRSIFSLALEEADQFPFSNGKLTASMDMIRKTGLKAEDAVSVNEISTLPERINHYKEQGAKLESMEGAALHYVALMEKVPFLQIRAVSNMIGERDKNKWDMKGALVNLNDTIINLIKKFGV